MNVYVVYGVDAILLGSVLLCVRTSRIRQRIRTLAAERAQAVAKMPAHRVDDGAHKQCYGKLPAACLHSVCSAPHACKRNGACQFGSMIAALNAYKARTTSAPTLGEATSQTVDRERWEQGCPHGVDDGACKQCYSEATRSAKGYSKEWCMRMAELEPEDGIPPIGIAAPAATLGEQQWPSSHDAAIQACALMILGICKTEPQEVWPKKIEERIRYMLSKLQPQATEPKGLTAEEREALEWAADRANSYARTVDSETKLTQYARVLHSLLSKGK